MTDHKKHGVVFWAAVVVGFGLVLAGTIIATVGIICGLLHYDDHALLLMADLRRMRKDRG